MSVTTALSTTKVPVSAELRREEVVVEQVVAVFVLPVSALTVFGMSGALTVALVAGVTRAHAREHCAKQGRCPAAPSVGATLIAGVLAGVGCIAAAGLIAVFAGMALVLILVLCVSAPASLRRPALRSFLHALHGHQDADPTAEVRPDQARIGRPIRRTTQKSSGADRAMPAPPLPAVSARVLSYLPNPEQCALLAEVQLCWWWRVSFVTLQKAGSTAQRTVVIETRRALLDELADRDPHSFARWLASGARAASDPARFFTATTRPPI